MFQVVITPIIRSTQLYKTASGIVNQYCCQLLPWLRWNISSTVAASSSIGCPFLKLFVQLCAPDDGRRNRLKHVERL
jgi:hypothetical protein